MVSGKVALITGGGNGIGAATARRFAGAGMAVVVADVDETAGAALARDIDGLFVRCDVTEPGQIRAAVAATVDRFGGLDVAFLNAGVAPGSRLGADFDLAAYRRAMAVNVDGVVFGINAALPALGSRGGGAIVVSASLAGLTSEPSDPVYSATKHALVGLVRALGPVLARDSVRINAVCPGYVDTRIIDRIRHVIEEAHIPLLAADDVARAVCAILDSDAAGQAWFVQPGRPAEPFAFRNVPGPRGPGGERVGSVPALPA